MTTNIRSFVRRINRRAKNIETGMDETRRDVVRAMLDEVVISTPVDTGTSRSNWQIGVNAPPSSVLRAYAPGSHLGIGERANAAATIAAGNAVIASSSANDKLYIVNNYRSIGFLNDGWSEQAAGNFIGRAFRRAQDRIRRTRLLG